MPDFEVLFNQLANMRLKIVNGLNLDSFIFIVLLRSVHKIDQSSIGQINDDITHTSAGTKVKRPLLQTGICFESLPAQLIENFLRSVWRSLSSRENVGNTILHSRSPSFGSTRGFDNIFVKIPLWSGVIEILRNVA
jgi:hypothetical protein